MADQVVLEQSLESQIVDEPFVSRQSVYVIDSNNGSYNGQIQIDTSSLSNSGRWVSYSEGVLQIPLVVTLTANAAPSSASVTGTPLQSAASTNFQNLRKNFAVGLKNGYYQLIHSLSVEYNNTSVVQLTPFLNHYVTYKLMTSLSEQDLDKWGTQMGFFPDSWQSHDYDVTTGVNPAGKGSINNKNLPAVSGSINRQSDVRKFSTNTGFQQRSFNCTSTDGNTTTTSPIFSSADTLNNLGRNYYAHQAVSNVDAFYVIAQIRLKDIADFFDKLPLTRGAYLRILVNTNTAEHALRYVVRQPATGNPVIVQAMNLTSTTITGGTTPLMVASAEGQVDTTSLSSTEQRAQGSNFFAQKTDGVLGATGSITTSELSFTVRASIAKDTTANITHPTFQQCRLYVPLYTMTNEEVSRYLTLQPTKNIVYRDVFQYQFDVVAGGTFNQLLTNGVSNPKALILIPYINASANQTTTSGTAVTNNTAVWQSPFSSEPGTTSPYVGLRDYNVQLAGVNVYTSNTLYDFDAFRNELARINGINGGVVDGLMSGLIGQEQFQTNMRYYVTDLSRRIKAEDAVPKSIQVSGQNASNIAISVFVFLEFERSVSISLDSGMLLG